MSNPVRRRLPAERQSLTHRFSIAGFKGYVTVGLYEDGTPGELFVTAAKQGSALSGLLDAWAIGVSLSLQFGVAVEHIVRKFRGIQFEPAGITSNPDIRFCSSVVDYVARWLEMRFVAETRPRPVLVERGPAEEASAAQDARVFEVESGPVCVSCGAMMVPSGKCYRCPNCGDTSGCS